MLVNSEVGHVIEWYSDGIFLLGPPRCYIAMAPLQWGFIQKKNKLCGKQKFMTFTWFDQQGNLQIIALVKK